MIDLRTVSTREILSNWTEALDEMKRRDLLRSSDNPVVDLSRKIVRQYFGGPMKTFDNDGWSVITPKFERILVRGMRVSKTSSNRVSLSAVKGDSYDSLVIVKLGHRFELDEVYKLPRAVVEELFPNSDKRGNRPIRLSKALIEHPGVIMVDMTTAYEMI